MLIAGDVYDRAIAPVDAVALCEDALARLRDTGARVIVISGNHDSALPPRGQQRADRRVRRHLRTNRARLAEPVVLTDEHGPVAVYGVPYLEPALGLPDETPATVAATPRPPPRSWHRSEVPRQRSHAAVLGEAAARIRADAAARGMNRTVVMAHAWVAAGSTDDERRDAATRQQSSSERDISVGGIGYVPAALFDGFSYVALGHLHGQQTLAEHLRYSGSPLPYSFSEKNHKKGSWLVEVGIDGKTRVERVAAPVYRRLAELAGRIDDLLTSAEYADHEDDFVAVTLTDTARPEAAMDRLRRRFPHVLTLEFKPEGVTGTSAATASGSRAATTSRSPPSSSGTCGTPRPPRSSTSCSRPRSPPPGTRRRHPRGRPLMRPHRLRVQAFGAFAATEQVTFDDLEGLFLLHGETGAGKTTLLDAIAFALYGRVPGERGSRQAAPLRPRRRRADDRGRARGDDRRPAAADHPQAGAGPPEEVGRRRHQGAGRGPAGRADRGGGLGEQVRPRRSRRTRRSGISWACRPSSSSRSCSSRRASSRSSCTPSAQDKEGLLQKLFGTDRFRAVEDWLADRRRATAQEAAAAAETSPPGRPGRPGRRRRRPRAAGRRTGRPSSPGSRCGRRTWRRTPPRRNGPPPPGRRAQARISTCAGRQERGRAARRPPAPPPRRPPPAARNCRPPPPEIACCAPRPTRPRAPPRSPPVLDAGRPCRRAAAAADRAEAAGARGDRRRPNQPPTARGRRAAERCGPPPRSSAPSSAGSTCCAPSPGRRPTRTRTRRRPRPRRRDRR